MILWRRHVSWPVSGWLICQLGALTAVPLALDAMALAAADDEACCPGVGPGQACPMHHTREEGRKCVMVNACGTSSLALLSLTSGLGVLPSVATIVSLTVPVGMIEPASLFVVNRPARPDLPPPRA